MAVYDEELRSVGDYLAIQTNLINSQNIFFEI